MAGQQPMARAPKPSKPAAVLARQRRLSPGETLTRARHVFAAAARKDPSDELLHHTARVLDMVELLFSAPPDPSGVRPGVGPGPHPRPGVKPMKKLAAAAKSIVGAPTVRNRSEAIKAAASWVRAVLCVKPGPGVTALGGPLTSEAQRADRLVDVLARIIREDFGNLPHATTPDRAKLRRVVKNCIRHGEWTETEPERFIEGALVVAGLGRKTAHEWTTVLRQKRAR